MRKGHSHRIRVGGPPEGCWIRQKILGAAELVPRKACFLHLAVWTLDRPSVRVSRRTFQRERRYCPAIRPAAIPLDRVAERDYRSLKGDVQLFSDGSNKKIAGWRGDDEVLSVHCSCFPSSY